MTWNRFKQHRYQNDELGFALDISRIPFPDDYLGFTGQWRTDNRAVL